ncbi:NADH dehydrogenase [ubiquinone] 1 alpha subcomplex subunit 2 [Harpegnathos saltator]|uniref:NADH dehydrogenase [ubiquinone] 1 alpha subcomplex subunit 2 n=1 Tax=Harpegnathos saltator TaxID=610380 RepID=E2BE29_HARSA|nr:NADH dehydrogenase [ubiquinone] 1 alpha subcomplex subunit 2 [Harpegnathos saltator]EFN86016.1 NADH dehydrogenase [ubiquinone] 1 alpha subcomplex subunit 2 [Harpegnathos saltator]
MATIKFGKHLKELRILLCQTSKSSQGVRDFIEQQYVSLKKNNPTFPILIRECSSIEPKLYARYEYGAERCASLSNLKSDDVFGIVRQLASQK